MFDVSATQAKALLAACKIVAQEFGKDTNSVIEWLSLIKDCKNEGNILLEHTFKFWINRDPNRLVIVSIHSINKEGKDFQLSQGILTHAELADSSGGIFSFSETGEPIKTSTAKYQNDQI
jgi:hypothetical protein